MTPPSPFPRPVPRGRLPVIVTGALLTAAFIVFATQRWNRNAVPAPVPKSELVQRDGRIHRIGSDQAFTGVMVEHYADGSLRSRTTFRDGLMDGPCEGWHTNGVRQSVEFFRSGVSDGVRTKWYPSGAKLSEATIVAGRIEGVFRSWHENGQLAEEIAMAQNEPAGEARAWYPSGYLRAAVGTNLSAQTERRHWRDGETRVWPEIAAP